MTDNRGAPPMPIHKAYFVMVRALQRLASSTEMAGNGETETMTGPAAGEMRVRMRKAARTLEEIGMPVDHTEPMPKVIVVSHQQGISRWQKSGIAVSQEPSQTPNTEETDR